MHLRRPVASLRFKLTTWYVVLLSVVLVAVALSVLRLAEERLLSDMDARLYNTAADIVGVIEGQIAARSGRGVPVLFDEVVPALGSFTSRGLLIQIVDADGRVVRRSEAAPAVPLMESLADPDGRRVERRSVSSSGWSVRVVGYPLLLAASDGTPRPIGGVLVGERMDTFRETLASVRLVLLSTSALGLALASIGGWLLAGRALRPVDRITATAAAVAVGEGTAVSLERRLDVPPTGDELARLAVTFNAMLDRLQAAFLAQRRFVADASHELRTPLAAIRGNTDVLARQVLTLPDHPVRQDLIAAAGDMQRESRRMGRLLDDLLFLARSDADAAEGAKRLERAPVRLDEVAAEAYRTANGLANGQHLRLETVPVAVEGDRDKLVQVALALLDNALRHTAPDDPIVVVVRTCDGWAELEVHDAGTGIASEDMPHLFERFFRADGARDRQSGGAGLGLAIARAIAVAHGGEITARSVPGLGSTFRFRLPAIPATAEPGGAKEIADTARTSVDPAPPAGAGPHGERQMADRWPILAREE